jgi:hypothetical protein
MQPWQGSDQRRRRGHNWTKRFGKIADDAWTARANMICTPVA